MITREAILKLKVQFQTTELNILCEYCQHLFLSSLYQIKEASKILFKGGTALRIIYQSPRFSEDLDFSSSLSVSALEDVLERNLIEIERTGVQVTLEEAKKTSGGYLAIIVFQFSSFPIKIYIEISKRPHSLLEGEVSLIQSDFIPSYSMIHLAKDLLVKEKIEAALSRAKPRDFFDIYFMLRANLISIKMKKKLKDISRKMLEKSKDGKINFINELKVFLPVNQHIIIKDFNKSLKDELQRHGIT